MAAVALVAAWFAEFYVPPTPYLAAPTPLERLYASTLVTEPFLVALGLGAWTLARIAAVLAGLVYWRDARAAPSYVAVLVAYAVAALAAKAWRHALFAGMRPLFGIGAAALALVATIAVIVGAAVDGFARVAALELVVGAWASAALVASVLFARSLASARRAVTASAAAAARAAPPTPIDLLAPVRRVARHGDAPPPPPSVYVSPPSVYSRRV